MPFKKILVPLAGVDSDTAAIDVSLRLGQEFGARIEALCAEAAPGDSSAGRIEADVVRAQFTRRCAAYGINELGRCAAGRLSADFVHLSGSEADLVAERGRLCDLLVFSRASAPDRHWPSLSIEAALRETARPVLLVPRPVSQLGTRSVIAWNGSMEAARALAFAIPMLLRGLEASVITAGNHGIKPSGDEVVEYLQCHGIKAASRIVPVEQSSESAALLAACRNFNADLIVLGAYTRHRTGRPVFGSMTLETLNQTELPIFMAH